jgi:methylaspartate ammonia-lyase
MVLGAGSVGQNPGLRWNQLATVLCQEGAKRNFAVSRLLIRRIGLLPVDLMMPRSGGGAQRRKASARSLVYVCILK